MTTTARIEIVGVKDTINQLNKLDKELAKEFKASATSIAQPAINAANLVNLEEFLLGLLAERSI